MLNIIISYIKLIRKYQYNTFWIIVLYIFLPIFVSIIPIVLKYLNHPFLFNKILDFIKLWSSEIINMFVLLSWFLLTSITMILSNSQITKEAIERISKQKQQNEEKIYEYLEWLKALLMYEIIIQFILIVISTFFIILIKVWLEKWIIEQITEFFTLFFIALSWLWLYRLLYNFITYQKNTSFKNKIN